MAYVLIAYMHVMVRATVGASVECECKRNTDGRIDCAKVHHQAFR